MGKCGARMAGEGEPFDVGGVEPAADAWWRFVGKSKMGLLLTKNDKDQTKFMFLDKDKAKRRV
jgi:hypothetical protein